MLASLLALAGALKKGNVTINGDLRVVGGLSVNHIVSSSLSVNGSITVSGAIKTGFIRAQAAKFLVLETTQLASPSGSVQVAGDLDMRSGASAAASFLEVGTLQTERLVQHRQRQWALVHHDDFESGAQQDWVHADDSAGVPASFVQLSSGGGGAHLGGHCQTAGTTVRRRFDNLPQHTHLRLQARYHFIDSWEGETAFLQIDGQTAWMDSADSRSGPPGINVAGGPTPERRWGVPVDVVMPHDGATALIEFGSNLDQDACDESFGVDDVQLHVR